MPIYNDLYTFNFFEYVHLNYIYKMAVLTDNTYELILHTSVISNDEVRLYNAMLQIGEHKSIDVLDSYGRSPLHWASMLGYNHMVQALLNHNANPNMQDNEGNTPLHMVYTKNIKSAKLLLSRNADPDIQNHEGETPLFTHASKGNTRIVKILMEYKANQTIQNNIGVTPLYMAITNGHIDTTELLLINASLQAQHLTGDTSIINSHGLTHLTGETLLHAASLIAPSIAERMIPLLCNYGANFTTDKFNATPLHWAAAHNNHNAVRIFIEYGKATNTLKHFIDHKDNLGNTPLHYAAWHGYESVVYVLLANDANPQPKDNYGLTPRDYAMRSGKHQIVQMIDTMIKNE